MVKEVWKYGLAMTILLALLKFLEYRFWMRDIPLELMVLIFALFFTILGVWMGWKLTGSKNSATDQANFKPESLQETWGQNMLTERELEVLRLLAAGCTNDEIADQLFISINTVKTHVSNLYLKLEVKRRTEAIRKARALNLIKD